MVIVMEREIESGGSSSTSGPSTPNGESGATKASGVEEHVSSAHARPGHGSKTEANGSPAGATAGGSKKREYTVKQMEVVTRVKRCKHHEYYEILAGQLSPYRYEAKLIQIQWRGHVPRTTSRRHTKSSHWRFIPIRTEHQEPTRHSKWSPRLSRSSPTPRCAHRSIPTHLSIRLNVEEG